MNFNYPILVYNMRNILIQNNLLDAFKKYKPSEKTGYVYDTSDMMLKLKEGVKNDKHSDSSFSVCCNMLKKSLN